MPIELVWHPQTREDMLEIYVVIGRDNPAAAEKFFDALETKANMLIEHPRLGPRRPDIYPGARMLVEQPYVILYETKPDTDDGPVKTVEIVRVVDGRRDLIEVF